jgi:hypothetical protein
MNKFLVFILFISSSVFGQDAGHVPESLSMPNTQVLGMELWQLVIFALILVAILCVALTLFGEATCYEDFNDLGVSLGVVAGPALVGVIVMYAALPVEASVFLVALPGVLCLLVTIWKTYRSNNIFLFPFMIITKVFLSFLYIIYLWQALAAKTRRGRGASRFILIILSPFLYALVKNKQGVFSISKTGRGFY